MAQAGIWPQTHKSRLASENRRMTMSKATILVVDDELVILEGIARILTQNGYDVLQATNGQEGRERLEQTTPDLILADIMMPVMDGYDFYRLVRQNPEWELIPFVFITAKSLTEDVRQGMRLGADDYLTKPFRQRDVLDVVETRLDRAATLHKINERKSEALKSQLLRLFNHELRTPLNSIVGYLDLVLLDDGDIDPDTLRLYVDGMSAGTERLNRLIEDILQVMEIEAGWTARAYASRKTVQDRLPRIIRNACRMHEEQATHKSVTMSLSVPDELPSFEADTRFLGDALSRIVDNAIKFSGEGDRVKVSAEVADASIVVTVADEGRGILPEEMDDIFDVFYQADRDTQEQQGAGLGLYIANNLIGLHGGEIKVESQAGSGSVFQVSLPTSG